MYLGVVYGCNVLRQVSVDRSSDRTNTPVARVAVTVTPVTDAADVTATFVVQSEPVSAVVSCVAVVSVAVAGGVITDDGVIVVVSCGVVSSSSSTAAALT